MRNLVFGVIGIVWGGGMLVAALFGKPVQSANPAFATGVMIGRGIGLAMFGLGLYYVITEIRNRQPSQPRRKTKKRKRRPAPTADE